MEKSTINTTITKLNDTNRSIINSNDINKNCFPDFSMITFSQIYDWSSQSLDTWLQDTKIKWKLLQIIGKKELDHLKSQYIKDAIKNRYEFLKSNLKKMIDSIMYQFKKHIITDRVQYEDDEHRICFATLPVEIKKHI